MSKLVFKWEDVSDMLDAVSENAKVNALTDECGKVYFTTPYYLWSDKSLHDEQEQKETYVVFDTYPKKHPIYKDNVVFSGRETECIHYIECQEINEPNKVYRMRKI